MEKKTLPLDKTKWGPGLWQTEPDRVEFEHKGLSCLIVRNPTGAWCGYAAVNPGHPWHGISYASCVKGCKTRPAPTLSGLNEQMEKLLFAHKRCDEFDHSPEAMIEVHGGLTYSDFCQGKICHVPKPGEPDNVYWFGFDCAHGGDLIPSFIGLNEKFGIKGLTGAMGEQYRDKDYAMTQARKLADQLVAVA